MVVDDSYYRGSFVLLDFKSSYYKNKFSLRDKIKSGNVDVIDRKPEFHSCYFCHKRIIDSSMKVVEVDELINGLSLKSKYYLHDHCYHRTLNYDYLLDFPFSKN